MLRKIAEIKLLDQVYDLARNDDHYHLVTNGQDAYGRPVAEEVTRESLEEFGADEVQALLDLVGELSLKLQGANDLRRSQDGAEPLVRI